MVLLYACPLQALSLPERMGTPVTIRMLTTEMTMVIAQSYFRRGLRTLSLGGCLWGVASLRAARLIGIGCWGGRGVVTVELQGVVSAELWGVMSFEL